MKERIERLHAEFLELRKQSNSAIKLLKELSEQLERTPAPDNPDNLTVWDCEVLQSTKQYNGQTFTTLPVYNYDQKKPLKRKNCVICTRSIPGPTNNKKFVRVSTDNLIVAPALKDLGVHDQGFFEICKSCAVYYPDEFVFHG